MGSWQGLLTTAGTPAAVVERLNAELNKILAMPDIAKRIEDLGGEVKAGPAAALAKWIETQHGDLRGRSSRKPASRCSREAGLAVLRRIDVKEVAFGLFLIALALVAFAATARLNVGTAADMGPGFVPRALAWVILGFGAAFCVTGRCSRPPSRCRRRHGGR